MQTITKNWNSEEFLAYTLLFSANADYVLAREERNLILSKVTEENYNSVRREIAYDNDYQSLQKILAYTSQEGYSDADIDVLLQEIESLFICDGNYDNLERNMFMIFKKVLKNQYGVAHLN